MLRPEKAREVVFLLFFGITQNKESNEQELMKMIMHEVQVSRSIVRESLSLCQNIISSVSVIDSMISDLLISFSFDRIQAVELTILRLCFWEMFIQKTTPPKVIMSEAKRLTKKFAEEEAVRFVLGLLMTACSKQGIQLDYGDSPQQRA